MKWLCILLAWIAFLPNAQASPPTEVQAGYSVFMSGMKVGQIDEVYKKSAGHYTLNSTTTPLGLLAVFKPEKIYLSSRGQVAQNGLKPMSFEDRREGNPAKSAKAQFDWTGRTLVLTKQAQHTELALPEGTQDRLSAMYQFMFIKLDGTVDFPMTNGSKLDNYHYTIGAREKLDTPAGPYETIYLDSQGKPGESRTEIWLSVEHSLPCKMIITDANGDQYTQILNGLKITP